jgi:HEPN domain-containing protein
MNSQADIEKLAEEKLKEANCLMNGNFYDGAFYMAGYSVELFLKAKICKTLNIPDFFLFKKIMKDEAYKPFKSHN